MPLLFAYGTCFFVTWLISNRMRLTETSTTDSKTTLTILDKVLTVFNDAQNLTERELKVSVLNAADNVIDAYP